MKRNLTKIFFDEIIPKPPGKQYSTNNLAYNHIDETWSIDIADMIGLIIGCETKKRFRFIIIIIDIFSKCLWAIPVKKKNTQIITNEVSNIIKISKRSFVKLESERGTEFYNNIFQIFLKKTIHQYSKFTDKGSSLAE